MAEAPESAADPRPGDEPYYIDNECSECGCELRLEDEDLPEEEIWHDEWKCPECGNLYLDWPQKEIEKLEEKIKSVEEEDTGPLEEV